MLDRTRILYDCYPNPYSDSAIADAYLDALHIVFLWAVPVAGAAFVAALFLKQVPLRGMSRGSANDMGDAFGMPDHPDSLQQLETAVGRLLRREGRTALPAVRLASGTALGESDGWCVGQVRVRRLLDIPASVDAVALRARIPAPVLEPAFAGAVDAGWLSGPLDDLQVTPAGIEESDKVVGAVKAWIAERLGPDGGDDASSLDHALEHLARTMLTDDAPALVGAS